MAEAVADAPPPEEVVAPEEAPPEVGPTSTAGPPEEVPTSAVATKKPRKRTAGASGRPPKVATKLAAVAEGVAETAPAAQEAQLPLEFWAGLMQTQKVIMAQRKSERYNSFRIT